jgi:hypothetical protein
MEPRVICTIRKNISRDASIISDWMRPPKPRQCAGAGIPLATVPRSLLIASVAPSAR